MSVIHKAKLTHYFQPSKGQLTAFFGSVTQLYGEGAHTDLQLVCRQAPKFVKVRRKKKKEESEKKEEESETGKVIERAGEFSLERAEPLS